MPLYATVFVRFDSNTLVKLELIMRGTSGPRNRSLPTMRSVSTHVEPLVGNPVNFVKTLNSSSPVPPGLEAMTWNIWHVVDPSYAGLAGSNVKPPLRGLSSADGPKEDKFGKMPV